MAKVVAEMAVAAAQMVVAATEMAVAAVAARGERRTLRHYKAACRVRAATNW